jgi:ribosomal small subunit protein bTHX
MGKGDAKSFVGKLFRKSYGKQSEFEEKTYEIYINIELVQHCSQKCYFPPGQVQEGKLGFDYSVYSEHAELWKTLGLPSPLDGTGLKEIAAEMEKKLSCVITGLPEMKTNLLLQYKRPEYITSYKAKEWKIWSKAYYRYSINPKQQKLLMSIDARFGDKVFIVYAAPALHTTDELEHAKKTEKVIARSNFCKASVLDGHRKNTYVKEGTHSIACSKPIQIENIDLLKEINTTSMSKNARPIDNREFIIDFSKGILKIMREFVRYEENNFIARIQEYESLQKYKLLYSHIVMKVFKEVTGAQWVVICGEQGSRQ